MGKTSEDKKTFFKSKIFITYSITIAISLAIILFGFFAENMNLEIFHYMPLSKFMGRCFEYHYALKNNEYILTFTKENCYVSGYIIYYIILYLVVVLYFALAIAIFSKSKKISWCSYVITISVIFLIFMNAYTTEMLQYPDETNTAIYNMHMTSFISIASILSTAAGIKIAFLFNNNSIESKKCTEEETKTSETTTSSD